MRRYLILLIYFIICAGNAFTTEPPLIIPAKTEKINQQLNYRLDSLMDGEKIKVWIFFTDKELFSHGEYRKVLRSIGERFTLRAIKRRTTRTGRSEIFDFHDIPVSMKYINQVRAVGLEIVHQSRWLNGVSVYGDRTALLEVAELPFVAEIKLVARGIRSPLPEGSFKQHETIPDSIVQCYGESYIQLNQIGVPMMHYSGYTGQGILIGLFDTGFRLNHPVFDNLNLINQYDFVDNDSSVGNETQHGTVTLSVIGGYAPGTLVGAAYGADFVVARTEARLYEEPSEEDNWVAAAEWADSLGVEVISSSLGYFDWYTYEEHINGDSATITRAADQAVACGIAVFTSAGNERNKEFYYITPPADGDSVIAVGAVNDNGVIASFSSAGPTFDNRIKPDIVAMGVSVFSARDDGGYGRASGTSLSAPLAAGAGALLLQAHPDWSPIDLREAMIKSADRYDNPDNLYGYGLINIFTAADLFKIEAILVAVGDSVNTIITAPRQFDVIPDSICAINLPDGAVFIDNHDGTGTLQYLAVSEDVGIKVFQILARFGEDEFRTNVTLQVFIRSHISAGPNPFSDSLTIFIGPDDGQPVEISIHAANGEKVWDNFSDNYNRSRAVIIWRGTNNNGSKVAPGVYFVIVRTEKSVEKIKVFKI